MCIISYSMQNHKIRNVRFTIELHIETGLFNVSVLHYYIFTSRENSLHTFRFNRRYIISKSSLKAIDWYTVYFKWDSRILHDIHFDKRGLSQCNKLHLNIDQAFRRAHNPTSVINALRILDNKNFYREENV